MNTQFARKSAIASLSLLAALVAVGSSLGGAAEAATAAPLGATSTTPAGQSCWIDADTGQKGCFATGLDPYEQISAATSTTVVAVPSGSKSPAQSSAAAPTPAATATSYILTSVWSGTSQTGDNQVYFTTNASICSGFTYGFPSLGTWNDRIKSFQSFNGCKTTLYSDTNYTGMAFGPGSASTNLGSFNAIASSLVAG